VGRPKLTPEIALNLAQALHNASGERDDRLESVIAQDAWSAYWYAAIVLECPFPMGESMIAQNVGAAYWYANNVLKTPEDRARFKKVRDCTEYKDGLLVCSRCADEAQQCRAQN
jgi:hypothetical protein